MTVYQKVLVELDKNSSIKTQYNNLVKLMHSSEDKQLRSLIIAWLNVLSNAEHYRVGKMSSHLTQLLNTNACVKQDLRDYCNDIIWSKKPEWQVLAERYGWRPPV